MIGKDILIRSKNLIKDPNNWIKGSLANDDTNSNPINTNNPNACKWCMLGAIQREAIIKAVDDKTIDRKYQFVLNFLTYIEHLFQSYKPMKIHVFNDSSSHKEVMDAFDYLIGAIKE